MLPGLTAQGSKRAMTQSGYLIFKQLKLGETPANIYVFNIQYILISWHSCDFTRLNLYFDVSRSVYVYLMLSQQHREQILQTLCVCAFLKLAFLTRLVSITHRFSGTSSNQILLLKGNKQLKVISQIKEHFFQLYTIQIRKIPRINCKNHKLFSPTMTVGKLAWNFIFFHNWNIFLIYSLRSF